MTKLYITRHGETEWNTKGMMQGWGNSPLTELGQMQGQWLRDRMKDLHIDVIYTSPSGRAYETAEIIRGNRDIEIIKDNGLQEINMGKWEGLSQEQIKTRSEENHFNFWNMPSKYKPEEGEDYYKVRDRSFKTITEILEKEKGKTILVVTHTITLKGFLNKLQNKEVDEIVKPPFIKQTSLTEIDFEDITKYKIHNLACMNHHEYSSKEFNE
ncbi:MAG: histidine phosphatase family protein [Clostridium sp.]